ncbi:unnamed protein product [Anisakis simplex]|uniref:Uncharacterized protein n=1 Tax=Anisakis simplex TaxID=6269 RepID=A0A0M3JIU1_ANISI|nr:unnamed protein product [Anisakis simplex]
MGAPTYTVPPSFISSPNRFGVLLFFRDIVAQMSCGYMPMIDERFMVPPPPPSATFAHICPPPPVPMILSANSVIPGYAPQPPQRVYQVLI